MSTLTLKSYRVQLPQVADAEGKQPSSVTVEFPEPPMLSEINVGLARLNFKQEALHYQLEIDIAVNKAKGTMVTTCMALDTKTGVQHQLAVTPDIVAHMTTQNLRSYKGQAKSIEMPNQACPFPKRTDTLDFPTSFSAE